MKWKAKKEPFPEDRRTVRKFAYLPIKVEGHWVWLDSYWSKQAYKKNWYVPNGFKWVEIERVLSL